ncbi:hypothetical protein JXA32_02960 [Candidatus Sumerlaeota bacterium]|nr:hypothetical protein [Candidatus Sumerlaeota bacterium]
MHLLFAILLIVALVAHLTAWVRIVWKAFAVSVKWGLAVLLLNFTLNAPSVCFMYLEHQRRIRRYLFALFAPYIVMAAAALYYIDWGELLR